MGEAMGAKPDDLISWYAWAEDIGPDGKVAQSSATSSDRDMQPVATCIAKNVRTWLFPMPKGGGNVVVNYPFVLKASGR